MIPYRDYYNCSYLYVYNYNLKGKYNILHTLSYRKTFFEHYGKNRILTLFELCARSIILY